MKSLAPLLVIAISISIYYVYIRTAAVDVKSLQLRNTELAGVLEKAKELKEKRDQISTSYDSIPGTDIDRLEKLIPEKFNQVLFINDITSIASKYGLIFSDFKSSDTGGDNRQVTLDPGTAAPYKTTLLYFTLNGQYSDFLKFLTDVETSLQLMDVVRLKIDPGSLVKSNNSPMTYNLEINTYSLK